MTLARKAILTPAIAARTTEAKKEKELRERITKLGGIRILAKGEGWSHPYLGPRELSLSIPTEPRPQTIRQAIERAVRDASR